MSVTSNRIYNLHVHVLVNPEFKIDFFVCKNIQLHIKLWYCHDVRSMQFSKAHCIFLMYVHEYISSVCDIVKKKFQIKILLLYNW